MWIETQSGTFVSSEHITNLNICNIGGEDGYSGVEARLSNGASLNLGKYENHQDADKNMREVVAHLVTNRILPYKMPK